MDLTAIYRETLARCAPERLVAMSVPRDAPRNVVAIGKSAGALLDGVGFDSACVAIPEGYRAPRASRRADVVAGGHPHITAASFDAGRRLIDFVAAHDDILFLVSGGGSACAELPLAPWFRAEDLVSTNARLVAAGLPVGEINTVRRHLSAIKGGRLGARVRGRRVTMVYSDVSTGALADVASGPTLSDPSTKDEAAAIARRIGCAGIARTILDAPETEKQLDGEVILIADNQTLTRTAAAVAEERGWRAVVVDHQIESDVAAAASELAARAGELRRGEVLVAGGEPTVAVRGEGRGGRCSELAVRFALAARARGLEGLAALFASSDGVDGNSGVAGIHLPSLPREFDDATIRQHLGISDSFAVAARMGDPIIIPAAGNNLRDLFLITVSS